MHETTAIPHIAQKLTITNHQVEAVATLLAAGATIPFIARYRKEATGALDEITLTAIQDELGRATEIAKRREAIFTSLNQRELLTDALRTALEQADSLARLEDIYLPFRPKRRTRAAIARERGLEPLAQLLLAQGKNPVSTAAFIAPEHGVPTHEAALAGAQDIIAERVSEDLDTRGAMRNHFRSAALIRSRVVEKNREQAATFRDYFDWQEPAQRIAGHRLLALFRGESEKMLSLSIRPDESTALSILTRRWVRPSPHRELIGEAVTDGYRRLLAPSLENELRQELKERADREAIGVFCANLRELLLAPPLGRKRVMALDPGFRTGAKLVCLDAQGHLLEATTVYPTQGAQQRRVAAETVQTLCARHHIEAIAIGSGTGGRETERFIRETVPSSLLITMVNEDGASVYSASAVARREFPDQDITVRGAVSIGRRLQDPLAELVKIDPKSIGVGQYQHDVDQAALKKGLDEVVMSCVNSVGVALNTASIELLTYVSGIGPALAAAIVDYRLAHGPFGSRKELLRVPRLGARAFEQAAGFLRIADGEQPLDASGVHPERYRLVETMAADGNVSIRQLIDSAEIRTAIQLDRYLGDDVGLPTLQDIMAELAKPGRDPRADFRSFCFSEHVNDLDDLEAGMVLPGIITNVTTFGAFVDIGVHRDGMIHISELADHFVTNPAAVVKVRQQVMVRVIDVDHQRRRINLSMKKQQD